ncbi:MAG: response regulator [Acidobacteria bacterium]|nr:response regulator [Acidobacteriota bacterium]
MKKSIVYLDDDPGCLDIFELTLDDEYEVRTATTPDVARRMLTERVADIIISDQSMPAIKGEDFLREVAEKYPASCRVMLTGQALMGGMIREVSTGIINLFIPKPWIEQNMRRMLERACLSLEVRSHEMRVAEAD